MTHDAIDQLEQSVIGGILIRGENLALIPSLETDHFRGYRAKATWEAIRSLEAKGTPVDLSTLGSELERAGKLPAVSWEWLGLCAICVPTPDNLIEYATQLRDTALARRVMEAAAEVLEAGKRGERTGAELLSMAMAGLSTLDADTPENAAPVGDLVKRRMSQLEQIAADRESGATTMTGFPTGVDKLDEKLGGWQPGIVSIVAARPGMGKSSLGLATADACSKAGFGVHLFSLEDTEAAYADRAMSRTSQVPAEKLRNSSLSRVDMHDIGNAVRSLRQRRGWIVDSRSGVTADEIVRSVRRKRKENATRVVIVDYVQLVKCPPRMSRHEALSEIVTTFADAAKHDSISYVIMSQLNRELEKRADRRPQLSDLRESGSLEERSKCVVAIYRGAAYDQGPKKGIDYGENEAMPSQQEFQRQVQLLVLKNSNGRTGTIRALWDGPTTRME